MNINKLKEIVMKYVFLFTAIISNVAVVLICVFLFANGVPAMKEIGFANFLGGTKWKPGNGLYGIFPMILGSIYVTGGALIIGVPIGILMSIFMARFCPDRLHKVLKPIVDLLAGIPSIVYGFFGLVVMVPFVREHFKGNGQSILTAALLLGSYLQLSACPSHPSEQWRRAIMRERSHWEPHMREVSLRLLFRQQNQVCLQQLCSA